MSEALLYAGAAVFALMALIPGESDDPGRDAFGRLVLTLLCGVFVYLAVRGG